jgi:hypothetical protein
MATRRSNSTLGTLSSPPCEGVIVRIAVSVEPFEAVARTLPLGSVGYETEATERSERYVWLEEVLVNRLGAMRGPGR